MADIAAASLTLNSHTLLWGTRTHVMGIINVTPDSFSGDGLGDDVVAAVDRGLALAREGADILDVGGESTRPGADPVSAEVEMRRVLPVITALRERTDLPISIDTYKAEVALAAMQAGAVMVNDVWGLRRDRRLAGVVAEGGAALIITHNRPAVPTVDALGGMYAGTAYIDLVTEVRQELRESVSWAETAGVPAGRIIVDPGLGFAKTPAQNLVLLRSVAAFRDRYPVLIGPSRKSFIGRILGVPAAERDEGTEAVVALVAAQGADIVRVHNVRAMVAVVRMVDAIMRGDHGR